MNMYIVILLAAILGLATQSKLKQDAGWTKDRFDGSNGFIDKCRSLSSKAIFSQFYPGKKTANYYSYALEIYRKTGDGLQFKLFFAYYDKLTKYVKFFSSLCKTDAPSSIFPTFNVEATDEVTADDEVTTDRTILAQIEQGIDMVRMQSNSEVAILAQYALPGMTAYFYIVESAKTKYIASGDNTSIVVKVQLL